MASFNKVILMGNLTRDPELRFTQSNVAIVKVGLAVNRKFKDGASGEWREEVTFVDITIFGKRGEAFEKYHKKGQSAFLEGELRFDTWEDKNTGQKRSKLYVVAENWEFVGGSRAEGGGRGGGEGWGGGQDAGYGGAPAQSGAAAQSGGAQSGDAAAGGAAAGGYDDYGGGGSDFIEADDTPF